jgi:hypothetical protein
MGFKMCLHNDTGTISAIPYAVLTLVIFGLFLIAMGPVIDEIILVDNSMMGQPTTTTPRPTAVPTPTPTPDPGQIACGASHALHLWPDGTVVGLGSDEYGQATPPAGLEATAISAGEYHSLALRADGTVVGWGYNHSGQATPPAGLVEPAL